jgi:hypothetical protein
MGYVHEVQQDWAAAMKSVHEVKGSAVEQVVCSVPHIHSLGETWNFA